MPGRRYRQKLSESLNEAKKRGLPPFHRGTSCG
jgi:hypothetical protein